MKIGLRDFIVAIPVRRAERKVGTIRPRFIHRARKRRPREQAGSIRAQVRQRRIDRMHPIRVEQRRRSRAVGKTETIAGRPVAFRHHAVEPRKTRFEQRLCVRNTVRVARAGRADRFEHDSLHRRHHVVVEHPVHHSNLERRARVPRNQPHRPGMKHVQVLDDDARFHHRAICVDQQGHPFQRPQRGELRAVFRCLRRKQPNLERRRVFIQRNQHFLAVRRKRV
jgi:hypothetical protein